MEASHSDDIGCGRSTSSILGNSLLELRGRRRDRSRRQRRISADADAAARGGREADGDPRGRRRGLVVGDAEAADGAGVVHLEPGDDAQGVVEVGAGELPCLGGQRQVVLADGADGGGLGHLDRGQRGDGRGRGGGAPGPSPPPPRPCCWSSGAGSVDVDNHEAAKEGARVAGVHDEVEVVGVVGSLGGAGSETPEFLP